MPVRNNVLANGEIYHILNRGVASQQIFEINKDYQRFISLIDYYQFDNLRLSFSAFNNLNIESRNLNQKEYKSGKTIVDIFAYCLMTNHFHLLVKQKSDNGIRNLLSKVQNAYAKYYNLKYKRVGPLFQSRFRAKWIETDEIFLHVSRYIHLNPCTAYTVSINKLDTYKWSSYPTYLCPNKSNFVKTGEILNLTGGVEQYRRFISNQAEYQRGLGKIKSVLME